MLPPAARPTTQKRSGKASTTRSTLEPTEPVEPRMERPRFTTPSANANGPGAGPFSPRVEEVIVQDGRTEQQAVEPVEHPAVAREQAAGVLHPRPPLEEALHQISRRTRGRGGHAEQDGVEERHPAQADLADDERA